MRHRHPTSVTVQLTYPEAWQLLNGVICRRGALEKVAALADGTDVLASAMSDLDHARGALERAMGLAEERRHAESSWSEAEMRYAHGDR